MTIKARGSLRSSAIGFSEWVAAVLLGMALALLVIWLAYGLMLTLAFG